MNLTGEFGLLRLVNLDLRLVNLDLRLVNLDLRLVNLNLNFDLDLIL